MHQQNRLDALRPFSQEEKDRDDIIAKARQTWVDDHVCALAAHVRDLRKQLDGERVGGASYAPDMTPRAWLLKWSEVGEELARAERDLTDARNRAGEAFDVGTR